MSCRTWSGIQFRFLDSGFRRNDDSPLAGGMKRKILTLSPSPADCKKLSIYSQHPSPQGEGTSGNPTASGWGIKKIKTGYTNRLCEEPRASARGFFLLSKSLIKGEKKGHYLWFFSNLVGEEGSRIQVFVFNRFKSKLKFMNYKN